MPASSSPGKTTESAVYGYVQKPEIVDFRGQYFYAPNHVGSSSSHYPVTSATSPAWSNVARITNKSGKSITRL